MYSQTPINTDGVVGLIVRWRGAQTKETVPTPRCSILITTIGRNSQTNLTMINHSWCSHLTYHVGLAFLSTQITNATSPYTYTFGYNRPILVVVAQ